MEYQDDEICLQNGIFRQANIGNAILDQTIRIKPNPANDKVEISLDRDEDGLCLVKISDLLGHVILDKSFKCSDKKIMLDTRALPPSVYIVLVQVNNKWSKTEKLVINR